MAAIYLIRHGQASWGKQDYDELSEVGFQQATILGNVLQKRIGKPNQIVSGAMRRHQQTASAVLAAMDLPPHWMQDERWNEYDHHQLLGRFSESGTEQNQFSASVNQTTDSPNPKSNLHREFQVYFDKALRRWIEGDFDGEYAESWPDFKERVSAALQAVTEMSGTTLVFTSGGAISSVVRQIWQMPDSSWPQVNRVIANAAVTKLVVGRQGLHLSTFNDHSPFEGSYRNLLTYR